jgi:hypothetical protein
LADARERIAWSWRANFYPARASATKPMPLGKRR